jgi:5-methylcytosine-specific restriction endonuclease McrA
MRRKVNPSKALFDKVKRVRKKPKISIAKLRRTADRLLQVKYTSLDPRCVVCGSVMSCCQHHFVPKSQSNFLRYEPLNLVTLCSKCHTRHHLSGDPAVVATIIKVRGIEWFDKLQLLRKKPCKLNRVYLESVVAKLAVVV